MALGVLAVSEMLILNWLLLISGRAGLGLPEALVCTVGIAGANVITLVVLRALSWDIRPVWILSRLFMVGSLGAIVSGPPLMLVFLAASAGRWWIQPSIEPLAGAGPLLATGGGLALALGFGSMLWGYLIGQHRVEVERLDLPIRKLPAALCGLRIAHISDLHIGRQLRAPLLQQLVARVNAVEADLIVITGDTFDFDPRFIEEGCRELATLEARLGVFAILGNHDVYTGAEAVASGLAELTSIDLLRDEWRAVECAGGRLYLVGVEDTGQGWTERDAESQALERLAHEVPKDAPSLLLMHRPSYFRQAARLGFPVALAGHTHGGQISLPPPAQHHNVSRLISRWTRGLYTDGETQMYVNRGLGVAGPPVRINCTREITLLRLVARG